MILSHFFSLTLSFSLSFYKSFFASARFSRSVAPVTVSSPPPPPPSPPFLPSPPLNSFFFVVFFVSSEEKPWQLIYAGASWITKLKFSPWPCLVIRECIAFLASWIFNIRDDRVEKSINISWPFERRSCNTWSIFELKLIPFRIDLSIAA